MSLCKTLDAASLSLAICTAFDDAGVDAWHVFGTGGGAQLDVSGLMRVVLVAEYIGDAGALANAFGCVRAAIYKACMRGLPLALSHDLPHRAHQIFDDLRSFMAYERTLDIEKQRCQENLARIVPRGYDPDQCGAQPLPPETARIYAEIRRMLDNIMFENRRNTLRRDYVDRVVEASATVVPLEHPNLLTRDKSMVAVGLHAV